MTAHTLSTRNVRTYLAGMGATGALLAGAIVAFLSVGALFAFNGMPGDSGPSESDSLFVGSGGAPVAAATAVDAAPGAVAADAAPLPPSAVGALFAAAGPDGALPPNAPNPPLLPPTGGQTTVPGAPGAPPATTTTGGPAGGLVDGVDEATGNLGVDAGLGDNTRPLTDPVDEALGQTAPGVSDAVNGVGKGLTDTLNGILGGRN